MKCEVCGRKREHNILFVWKEDITNDYVNLCLECLLSVNMQYFDWSQKVVEEYLDWIQEIIFSKTRL